MLDDVYEDNAIDVAVAVESGSWTEHNAIGVGATLVEA